MEKFFLVFNSKNIIINSLYILHLPIRIIKIFNFNFISGSFSVLFNSVLVFCLNIQLKMIFSHIIRNLSIQRFSWFSILYIPRTVFFTIEKSTSFSSGYWNQNILSSCLGHWILFCFRTKKEGVTIHVM